MTDYTGQVLGNYRLVRLLGRGNWAAVYLGIHVHLDTQAAIKVLHESLSNQDVQVFLNEARTIARLRHTHIVKVLDFGVEGTIPFLVMDYAPGGNLRRQYPQGTQLPLAAVVAYVRQVAEGLQYAHDENVIHRDIKPENMLLGYNNDVLLSDFGIAVIAQNSHSRQAQDARDAAGTIAYMAPEQIQAYPSFASDQYALAIVVYEWLCGERPFSGTFPEIVARHALVPPPPLHEKVPAIPATMEQVVLTALAKDPKQRFANVLTFAMALEEAYRREPSGARAGQHTGSVQTSANDLAGETTPLPFADPLYKPFDAYQHNLPGQLTPLIGREQAVMAVSSLLQRPAVRLVTLTGTGGIGKTRLCLQVATESLETFSDGICFVQLASISNPALVVPTVAHILSLQQGFGEQRTGMVYMEYMKTFLRDKNFLLVLDNFEQVVMAAPDLTGLLTACPSLKILVTSRVILHVHGEHEFAVLPLALPDRERVHLPDSETLLQYPAVALFLQRTLAVKANFAVTTSNMQAIADICIQLDGLPLAIELAAARIKLLPPQALLQRLSHRLQVLTGGVQDAPVRQQKLRDTIAWSYNLLNIAEQQLFRRLSVFVGGSTLEAIESICSTFANQAGQVLDRVASLIDQSLLQQTEQEGDESRVVMLETIREYALECLIESGEEEMIRQAHAGCYLALAEASEKELGGPRQKVWLERLEREHDNLRAALEWSLNRDGDETEHHTELTETAEIVEIALRLAGALRRFWQMHGHLHEGQIFLERALSASEGISVSAQARAKALIAAGTLASIQNNFDRTEAYCRESLLLFRELGDKQGIALSLYLLSVVPWMKSDNVAARSLTEEALALFREMGDKERIAWSFSTLGLLDTQEGKYTSARTLYEESLVLHRGLGDRRSIATTLLRLAQLLFVSQGDQAELRSLLEDGLTLFTELGEKEGIANSYAIMGQLAFSHGDAVTARSQLEESIATYRKIGHRKALAESLAVLARIVLAQGEQATTRTLYEESLTIARELNHLWLIASCLEGWASMVAVQGQFVWAAQLWGAAESLRKTINVPIPQVERVDYERSIAAAHAGLDDEIFVAAWAQGRAMTPEQAIAAKGREVAHLPVPTIVTPPLPYSVGLTAREVGVLRLVAQGLTNTQIAQKLVLSDKTVATHLTHIFNKTNSDNRAAAAAFAIRHGLI